MGSKSIDEQTSIERHRSYLNHRPASVNLGRSISDIIPSQLPRVLKLEDITMLDPIGKGAFGTIYKVKHNDFPQDLVIKQVISEANDCRDALIREISLLQRLKHPCLLNCVGVVANNQQLYMVTEFIPAGSLHNYILERPHRFLSWWTLTSMATDIASVMTYLHEQGIVHRDLTTHNCLVGNDNSVVVSDLGLALLKRRISRSNMPSPPATAETLSPISENADGSIEPIALPMTASVMSSGTNPMSGSAYDIAWRQRLDARIVLPKGANTHCRNRQKHSIAGSRFWMAPEMFASRPYDEAVDVYSFGVILCQLIGRVDADPDVMERWSSTLSVNMEHFVGTHAPPDTPKALLDLAFACTCLSDDERPTFTMCYEWLRDQSRAYFNKSADRLVPIGTSSISALSC